MKIITLLLTLTALICFCIPVLGETEDYTATEAALSAEAAEDCEYETTDTLSEEENSTEEIAVIKYEENTEIYVVALNADVSQYLESSVSLRTAEGGSYTAQIEWQSKTAPNTQGFFKLEGKIILPSGVSTKDESSLTVYKNFYAMNDDKIYLSVCNNHYGNFVCDWIYYVEDTENIEIQYSYDGESWRVFDNKDEICCLNPTQFIIAASQLAPDTDYYFRLLYSGEYTDIIYINSDTKVTIIEGDHDGGDNYEQTLPAVIQSAYVSNPKASSDSSSSKSKKYSPTEEYTETLEETIIEKSDENSTVISGKRLKDLAEINDKIIFEKEGISAELETDFIENNQIEDDDIISVTIDKTEDNNFTIDVSLNNKTVEEIPNTIVRFPSSESRESSPEETIEEITINTSGKYELTSGNTAENPSKAPVTDEKQVKKIMTAVIFLAVILAALITYAIRRTNKKCKTEKMK